MDGIVCDLCGGNPPESITPECTICGKYIGHPNVREVERKEEKEALYERYLEAMEASRAKGSHENVQRFEAAMKQTSAVVNVDLDYLYYFARRDRTLYSTYTLQVEGEIRDPATSENDKRRSGVEATIFGSYAKQIRYAALSLDGYGLSSYGNFALQLREEAIVIRASLLEENTYDFVQTHGIKAGGRLPLGYRASWKERYKLAVAKLAERIAEATSSEEYSRILLFSEGDRSTDAFIEVHIYGPFNIKAVEAVRGKVGTKSKRELATFEEIKEFLDREGISLVK